MELETSRKFTNFQIIRWLSTWKKSVRRIELFPISGVYRKNFSKGEEGSHWSFSLHSRSRLKVRIFKLLASFRLCIRRIELFPISGALEKFFQEERSRAAAFDQKHSHVISASSRLVKKVRLKNKICTSICNIQCTQSNLFFFGGKEVWRGTVSFHCERHLIKPSAQSYLERKIQIPSSIDTY